MNVTYLGKSDAQEFGFVDFRKAGVEVEEDFQVTFHYNVPTEVSEEVGAVLLDTEGVFGDFPFLESDEEPPEVQVNAPIDDQPQFRFPPVTPDPEGAPVE